MDLNGKRILLTGGTGSFGQCFARMTKERWPDCKIRIFSRDEMKQWEMEKELPELDYYLGDVRDTERVLLASKGCEVVIHAAALKIVPKGERDPLEFIKTIIGGAENVISAALKNGVKRVIALSTDKAVAPINLYGAAKLCADKLFMAANSYNFEGFPKFSVVRYGNIMGSRGSVIPLFLKQAKAGGPLTITNPDMTRFMFTLEGAVKLVWMALKTESRLYIADCKSMKISDIAKVCWKHYYSKTHIYQTNIGIRDGEKMHETLGGITSEFAERMTNEELKEWISNYLK